MINKAIHSEIETENKNPLINIDPSHLRKYIREYVLIALASCVVFLFFAMRDLNTFIIKNLTEQRMELIRTAQSTEQTQRELVKVIEKNTDAIQSLIKNQK